MAALDLWTNPLAPASRACNRTASGPTFRSSPRAGVIAPSPAQSASSLVVYERGHLGAGEIFRFGLLMTALAALVVLAVAVPYWGLIGEPLIR